MGNDIDHVSMTTNFTEVGNNVSFKTASELNTEAAEKLVLVLVYLCLLLVLGLPSNCLVLYIYAYRIPLSSHKCFILCLAILDIINCCFGIPIEILDLTHLYNWMPVIMCKVVRFIHTFISTNSGLILVLIGFDRFNLVCRMRKKKMSIRTATACCVFTTALSVAFTWPAAVLHGDRTVNVSNITVTECSIEESHKENGWAFRYHIMQCLLFFVAIGTISVLYFLIAMKIRNVNMKTKPIIICKYTPPKPIKNSGEFEQTLALSFYKEGFFNKKNRRNSRNHTPRSRESQELSNMTCDSEDGLSNLFDSNTSDLTQKQRFSVNPQGYAAKRLFRREKQVRNVTAMMFAISLGFMLSFLPHLSLMIAKVLDDGIETNLSKKDIAYNIFLRSYFINNVINPIIYGVFDRRLRRECKILFKKLFCKERSHSHNAVV